MKLRSAVEENASISEEIASMKMTLMRLQTERLKSSGRSAHEVDAALAKVPALCLPRPVHPTQVLLNHPLIGKFALFEEAQAAVLLCTWATLVHREDLPIKLQHSLTKYAHELSLSPACRLWAGVVTSQTVSKRADR